MFMRMTFVIGAVVGILGCGPSAAEIAACKASKESHAANWAKYGTEAAKYKEAITRRTENLRTTAEAFEKAAAKPDASEGMKAKAKFDRAEADAFKAELDAYENACKAADAAAKVAPKASDAKATNEKALVAAKAARDASVAAEKLVEESMARSVKDLRDSIAESQKLFDNAPEWMKKNDKFKATQESSAADNSAATKRVDKIEKDNRASAEESAARIKEIIDLATAADTSIADPVATCAKVDK